MANVQFKRGKQEALPVIQDGSLLFTTDTGKIYLDQSDKRVALGGVGQTTPENGEIFNDYENNKALTNSHSEGFQTVAGGKGFRISAYTTNSVTLEGYSEFIAENPELVYEVGDEYSYQMDNNYDFNGTISAISGNTITVTGTIAEPTGEDPTRRTFWVTEKPLVGNIQLGQEAHAEGYDAIAFQIISHAEGYGTRASGKYSHAEGRATVASYGSHSEGWLTKAIGQGSHAEGKSNTAIGDGSHVEGVNATTTGPFSHGEGQNTQSGGNASHAEGYYTEATGDDAHAEGSGSKATAPNTHAEGYQTEATADSAHSEGKSSKATGEVAHAEGEKTTASGRNSHAEGRDTTVNAGSGHAEGFHTLVSGGGGTRRGRKLNRVRCSIPRRGKHYNCGRR